jgi:uncharacterized protein YbaA (DUF1428 family)
MAHYVDGFVIPLPEKNVGDYRRMAQKAGKVWRDHGALEFRECVGDDLDIKMGKPFTRGIKTKPGETVLFSYIVFKSRAHRDRVNAKVMKDPRIAKMMGSKPYALRCETHALRRVQDHRRSLSCVAQFGYMECSPCFPERRDLGPYDRFRQSGLTEGCRLDIAQDVLRASLVPHTFKLN